MPYIIYHIKNPWSYLCHHIQEAFQISSYFNDHNSTLCSMEPKPPYSQSQSSSNLDPKPMILAVPFDESNSVQAYNVDFMSISNLHQLIIGCIASFTWTILFIIYHLSLLNYPAIYHTKTAVLTVFLASLANVTLSTSLSDPYTFAPNVISIFLSMIHFSSWAYHMKINVDSSSILKFITFNRSEITQIIKTGNNTSFRRLSSLMNYSNNTNAHLNPHSIPNRRKRNLYRAQKKMRQNMDINFDNSHLIQNSKLNLLDDNEDDTSTFHANTNSNSNSNALPDPPKINMDKNFSVDTNASEISSKNYKTKVSFRGRHPNQVNMTDSKFVKIMVENVRMK